MFTRWQRWRREHIVDHGIRYVACPKAKVFSTSEWTDYPALPTIVCPKLRVRNALDVIRWSPNHPSSVYIDTISEALGSGKWWRKRTMFYVGSWRVGGKMRDACLVDIACLSTMYLSLGLYCCVLAVIGNRFVVASRWGAVVTRVHRQPSFV